MPLPRFSIPTSPSTHASTCHLLLALLFKPPRPLAPSPPCPVLRAPCPSPLLGPRLAAGSAASSRPRSPRPPSPFASTSSFVCSCIHLLIRSFGRWATAYLYGLCFVHIECICPAAVYAPCAPQLYMAPVPLSFAWQHDLRACRSSRRTTTDHDGPRRTTDHDGPRRITTDHGSRRTTTDYGSRRLVLPSSSLGHRYPRFLGHPDRILHVRYHSALMAA